MSATEVGPPLQKRREDILFYQNQEASSLFLIEHGLIKLTRTSTGGRQQILTVNGPHQLTGEECLSGGESAVYRAQAECLTDVSVYQVPMQTVLRLYGVPDFAAAMVGYAIRRDVEFIQKADLLVGHDVEDRILYGLAQLARMVRPHSEGTAFAIQITQAELASYVGATRETTSTILSQLQKKGLVMLSRRLITTVHPDLLLFAISALPKEEDDRLRTLAATTP